MTDIVVAEHLVKRYGPRLAVRDVSFAVAEGEIVGLLGPNGSGKSTILRMLTGYLPPSEGTIRIGELDVRKDSLAVRQRIGYVPEDTPLYEGMLRWSRSFGQPGSPLKLIPGLSSCCLSDRHLLVGMPTSR
jgi:ABC-2 type transport system ATP-binding protein